jgi:hypothetical protein
MKFETLKKADFIIILMFVLFLLLGLAGMAAGLYFYIKEGLGENSLFFAGGLILLIPSLFLYLQSFAWYTGYYLEDYGLLLRGVYKKSGYKYDEISSVECIDREEVQRLVEEPMEKANRNGQSGDLKGWYIENKRYGLMTQYLSVQFTHQSTGGESHVSETYTGVGKAIDLVKLNLRDGSFYLLSPREPTVFVKELQKKLS